LTDLYASAAAEKADGILGDGKMIVRKIKASDLGCVLGIMRTLPEWFTPDAVRSVRRSFRNHEGFVAIARGRAVGFALYKKWKKVAWLRWIGVLPAEQRKGVGSVLALAMESDVEKRGATLVRASTLSHTVKYAPYELTRKFYLKVGFAKERIDAGFYPDGGDRLLLVKRV